MPNYCHNILTVQEGDTSHLEGFMSFYKPPFQIGQEQFLDFDKILPMPEGINKDEESPNPEWYVWRSQNWGTKWGCIDCNVTQNEITFLTAWAPPQKVIHALAQLVGKTLVLDFQSVDSGFEGKLTSHPDGKFEYEDREISY